MFRSLVVTASRTPVARGLVASGPVRGAVVRRFVAGEDDPDAVAVARALVDAGLLVSVDRLGEDTASAASAHAAADGYVRLLATLGAAGLAPACEVSIKLSALGARIDAGLATALARRVCEAAADEGTTVTLDMEDHTTTTATLAALAALRRDHPDVGVAVQARLRRTEADCAELAAAGARVRLCKGAYAVPAPLAFRGRREVLGSYARCLSILLAGTGYPMVATHDPELISFAGSLAGSRPFEYQMLYGVRPDAQARLAAAGAAVRVYVPYGREWYGYLTRRIAERPANLMFFLRALTQRGSAGAHPTMTDGTMTEGRTAV